MGASRLRHAKPRTLCSAHRSECFRFCPFWANTLDVSRCFPRLQIVSLFFSPKLAQICPHRAVQGNKKGQNLRSDLVFPWSRGLDSNQRPSGYEPDELPDCSTPQCRCLPIAYKQNRQERILHCADDTSKPNHDDSRNIHKQQSKQPRLPSPANSGCNF